MLPKLSAAEKLCALRDALNWNKDAVGITRRKLTHNLNSKTEGEKKKTLEFMNNHCWEIDASGRHKRPRFTKAPDYVIQIGGELTNTFTPSYEAHVLVAAQFLTKATVLMMDGREVTPENLLDVWNSGHDPRVAIVHTIVDDVNIPRYVKCHPIERSLRNSKQHKLAGHFVDTEPLEIDERGAGERLAMGKNDRGLYTESDLELLNAVLHVFDGKPHSYEFMKALLTVKEEQLLGEMFDLDMNSNVYFHFTPYCTFEEESSVKEQWTDALKNLYTLDTSKQASVGSKNYVKLKGARGKVSVLIPSCPKCGCGCKYTVDSVPRGLGGLKSKCLPRTKIYRSEVGDISSISGCGHSWELAVEEVLNNGGAGVDFPAHSLLWTLAGTDGLIYEDPGFAYRNGEVVHHNNGKGDNPQMLYSTESVKLSFASGHLFGHNGCRITSVPIAYVQHPQVADPVVKQVDSRGYMKTELPYGTTNSSPTALIVHGMRVRDMFKGMLCVGYVPSDLLAKRAPEKVFEDMDTLGVWYARS